MKGTAQRFVKEYANHKIKIYNDLARSFPDREMTITVKIALIKAYVSKWEQGMIMTDEVMIKIAEA